MQVSFFAPSLVPSAPAASPADQTAEAKGGNAEEFASLLDSQPRSGSAPKDFAPAGNSKAKTPAPSARGPKREAPCAAQDQGEGEPAANSAPGSDVCAPAEDAAEFGANEPIAPAPAEAVTVSAPVLAPLAPVLPAVEAFPATGRPPTPVAVEKEPTFAGVPAAVAPEEPQFPDHTEAPALARTNSTITQPSPVAPPTKPGWTAGDPVASAVATKRNKSAAEPTVPAAPRPPAIAAETSVAGSQPADSARVASAVAVTVAPVPGATSGPAQPAAPNGAVPVLPAAQTEVVAPTVAPQVAASTPTPQAGPEARRAAARLAAQATTEVAAESAAAAVDAPAGFRPIPSKLVSSDGQSMAGFGSGEGIDSETTPAAAALRGRAPVSWRTAEQARATAPQKILQSPVTARSVAELSLQTPPAEDLATGGKPVANPILASQTLAQVLVETGAAAAPRPSPTGPAKAPVPTSTPAAATQPPPTPTSVAATELPSAPEVGPEVGEAPVEVAVPVPADQVPTETESSTEKPVRGLREILAAGAGRATRSEAPAPKGTTTQNFLNVEKQRVGAEEPEIGTRTANRAQSMSSHAPAQFAADAALDVFELPGAAAPIANPATGTSLKPAAEVAAPRSFAAAAVREAMNAVEKAQETGRTHIELRLPTQDNEGLRVHLDWRDGVVHARFVAPTSEMQHSLSREWEAVAPRFAERGLKFSEPSFEHHGQSSDPQSGQTAFTSDQQRHRSRGHSAGGDDLPEFALPTVPTAGAAASSRRAAPRAAAHQSHELADTRGLRVWA